MAQMQAQLENFENKQYETTHIANILQATITSHSKQSYLAGDNDQEVVAVGEPVSIEPTYEDYYQDQLKRLAQAAKQNAKQSKRHLRFLIPLSFPGNPDGHWIAHEVVLAFDSATSMYDVNVKHYDPQVHDENGVNHFDDEEFIKQIKERVRQALINKFPIQSVGVTNKNHGPDHYPALQAHDDNFSCGPIVTEFIQLRANGQTKNRKQPYQANEVQALRRRQYQSVKAFKEQNDQHSSHLYSKETFQYYPIEDVDKEFDIQDVTPAHYLTDSQSKESSTTHSPNSYASSPGPSPAPSPGSSPAPSPDSNPGQNKQYFEDKTYNESNQSIERNEITDPDPASSNNTANSQQEPTANSQQEPFERQHQATDDPNSSLEVNRDEGSRFTPFSKGVDDMSATPPSQDAPFASWNLEPSEHETEHENDNQDSPYSSQYNHANCDNEQTLIQPSQYYIQDLPEQEQQANQGQTIAAQQPVHEYLTSEQWADIDQKMAYYYHLYDNHPDQLTEQDWQTIIDDNNGLDKWAFDKAEAIQTKTKDIANKAFTSYKFFQNNGLTFFSNDQQQNQKLSAYIDQELDTMSSELNHCS